MIDSTHFMKLADGVDVSPILSEIDAHPELWGAIPLRGEWRGTPHARMSDIWFHYADRSRYAPNDLRAMCDEHIPIWYPAAMLVPSVRRLTMGLMAAVEGEAIGLVMATSIPPGAGIDPHADDGWHCRYHDKFYIPLQADPGAVFGCEADGLREVIETPPGEVILFDNRKRHWVWNGSDRDRIMLIVCIHTEKFNDWHGRG